MTLATGVGRGNNPASHNNTRRASAQHRWKPGGSVGSNGYVKIRVGKGHPLADPNGYAYEHLVVWVSAGNPRPPKGWILHHKNEDRTDNRYDNLMLIRRGEHNRLHNLARARDPKTGRLLPTKHAAGRLLDGIEHNGYPT